MKLIGISGVAGAGKDLVAKLCIELLNERGFKCINLSIANELKQDLHGLLKEKLNIDSFTENRNEKNIIRPVLVSYANMMRDLSYGTYWTKKLQTKIENIKDDYDYIFISDIRFHQYEQDEVPWLLKMRGKLVHVSCYHPYKHLYTKKMDKQYVKPYNEHEQENDPLIKEIADYKIDWPYVGLCYDDSKEVLLPHVKEMMYSLSLIEEEL